MNPLYLFWLFVFSDNVYSFKPDYAVKKQSKSIFSNKKNTETITLARYKAGNRNIKCDRSAKDDFTAEHNFSEVEYPTNISEASKPFYFKTRENNALLTHFPDDKTNFNSAINKTEIKKTNSKIVNDKKQQPKTLTVKNIVSETRRKKNADNELLKTKKPILNDTTLDTPLQIQLIPQSEITEKVNIAMSEKMIAESESHESYEDIDYYEISSIENKTADYYDDQVEIFNSDEVFFSGTSFEDRTPEDASVSEFVEDDYNSSPSNISSCSSKSEEPTVNSTTPSKLETDTLEECPLPTEKNTVQKAPKRLGLGPVSNVKKRKFLQQLYKTPSLFP